MSLAQFYRAGCTGTADVGSVQCRVSFPVPLDLCKTELCLKLQCVSKNAV